MTCLTRLVKDRWITIASLAVAISFVYMTPKAWAFLTTLHHRFEKSTRNKGGAVSAEG